MEIKKPEIILIIFSYHHKSTEKIANVFAKVLDAQIKTPEQVLPDQLQEYYLIGFGSGIYGGKHHKLMLDLADKLPPVTNRKAFIFSTHGTPVRLMNASLLREKLLKDHASLREKLRSKGYLIVDEFSCGGFNTNSFLKWFGGLNKGHPNAEDLNRSEIFAQNLKQHLPQA